MPSLHIIIELRDNGLTSDLIHLSYILIEAYKVKEKMRKATPYQASKDVSYSILLNLQLRSNS